MTGLDLARLFHSVYKQLAPEFRNETRPHTGEFDSQSAGDQLLIAVCESVLTKVMPQAEKERLCPDCRGVVEFRHETQLTDDGEWEVAWYCRRCRVWLNDYYQEVDEWDEEEW